MGLQPTAPAAIMRAPRLKRNVGPTKDDVPIKGDCRGMKPKTYLETTVVSYLAASPSRDIVIAGHQEIEQACRAAGLQAPVICTPEELMEA